MAAPAVDKRLRRLHDGPMQSFLLSLGEALRSLTDTAAIEGAAARLVAERVGAARAYYAECEHERGVCMVRSEYVRGEGPSLVGVHRFDELDAVADAGRARGSLVFTDTLDPRQVAPERGVLSAWSGVRAFLVVTLFRAEKMVAALAVSDTSPRVWTPLEVTLLHETAERTWAAVERAHAERALTTSETRLRTIVDGIHDHAVFLVDGSGIVTEWPAGAERLTGYTAGETVGTNLAFLYDSDDVARGQVERDLADAAPAGRVEREGWRRSQSGQRFWANEITTAVHDRDGQLVAFVKVTRDLSEQKQLQHEREGLLAALRASEESLKAALLAERAAHEAAERANKAKDEFLATLGHELRTPLAAILLWGKAVRSGAIPPQELGRAIEAILQSAESQSRLVEDLLDLTRLSSGKLYLARTAVAVDSVARESAEVVQPLAQEKGVALVVDVEPGLGTASLDAARLKQVLWNLLSNAVKFTPRGGRVTLGMRKAAGMLEAEVADTGEGIAPDFMPHVFERFRQANMGETREHAGLGIGLALSRRLVALQGGTIEAHSDGPGRGAVFRVRLPWVEPSEAPAADARVPAPPAVKSTRPLQGVTVLLVEDDTNTRDAMHWTLERAGARVTSVESGVEALAQLEGPALGGSTDDVLVVVSDLGLPGMSGYELIERIVERCRGRGQKPFPACAVSAHARRGPAARARRWVRPLPREASHAGAPGRGRCGSSRRRGGARPMRLSRSSAEPRRSAYRTISARVFSESCSIARARYVSSVRMLISSLVAISFMACPSAIERKTSPSRSLSGAPCDAWPGPAPRTRAHRPRLRGRGRRRPRRRRGWPAPEPPPPNA